MLPFIMCEIIIDFVDNYEIEFFRNNFDLMSKKITYVFKAGHKNLFLET